MSSPIWTPDALSSEHVRLQRAVWRIVEAQHRVSTLKLVDSLAEQQLLENIIEETKPPVPEDCRDLHYLLLTPFRYAPRFDSRFRRAGSLDGVFYASENASTAVAEIAFYRLLFFSESPETPLPTNPGEHTGFAVRIKTDKALDLTIPPLNRDEDEWRRLTDYTACHALADAARKCGTESICYSSVRDSKRGNNYAILKCAAFAEKEPGEFQSWRIQLRLDGVLAVCEAPRISMKLELGAFVEDERLAPFTKRAA